MRAGVIIVLAVFIPLVISKPWCSYLRGQAMSVARALDTCQYGYIETQCGAVCYKGPGERSSQTSNPYIDVSQERSVEGDTREVTDLVSMENVPMVFIVVGVTGIPYSFL